MKKLKVLHVIDQMGLGGAQGGVRDIMEYQQDSLDVFLLVLRRDANEIQVKHPNVIFYNSYSRYSLLPLLTLRRLIKENCIDVVHCHLPRSQVFGWFAKRFFASDVKLVFHERGPIYEAGFVHGNLLKLMVRDVQLFIAVSEATRQELLKYIPNYSEKTVTLYNGLDIEKLKQRSAMSEEFIADEKLRLGVKGNEFVLGFAGRFEEQKGVDVLIRALTKLNFPFKLLLLGDGTLRSSMEQLVAQLDLTDKVVFMGYRADALKYFYLMDVLVMPSVWEPYARTILEAHCLGVPCIASNVSGMPELIEDGKDGILFLGGDHLDLAEKINFFQADRSLASKFKESGKRSREGNALSVFVNKLSELYAKL